MLEPDVDDGGEGCVTCDVWDVLGAGEEDGELLLRSVLDLLYPLLKLAVSPSDRRVFGTCFVLMSLC